MSGECYKDAETLRRLYHEEELSQPEIGERFGVSHVTIGNWMERLGVETRENGKVPREKLIAELKRLAKELGRTPTQADMNSDRAKYSIRPYQREFGSWNAALKAVGLEPNHRNAIPDRELLNELHRVAEIVGGSPRKIDMKQHGGFDPKTYRRAFGSWTGTLRAGGYDLNKHPSEVMVNCAFCAKPTPKKPSVVEKNEYVYCGRDCTDAHKSIRYAGEGNPQSTLEEVECSWCEKTLLRAEWRRELNEHHFCDNSDCYSKWCSEYRVAENNPNFKRFTFRYMGPNWDEQRLKRMVVDQARCQAQIECDGMTEAENIDRSPTDRSLTGHHVIPRTAFYENGWFDWERANQVKNIRMVCDKCHQPVEHADEPVFETDIVP